MHVNNNGTCQGNFYSYGYLFHGETDKKKGRTEIDMHLSASLRNVVLLVIRNVQWALLILPTGGISKHEFVWRKK
jgi:hypothetical protein